MLKVDKAIIQLSRIQVPIHIFRSHFRIKNKIHNSHSHSPDYFNNYFTNIAKEVITKLPTIVTDSFNYPRSLSMDFSFQEITPLLK
jgi:hypothetical protein